MAQAKTNAMRILDARKIDYKQYTYDPNDGKIDGVSVAFKINRDPKVVYKTLVSQGISKELYVFVIPVEAELDLKKAAKSVGEKKVDMIPVKDIQKWTGYVRGGCSPIGMKKAYITKIDEQAKNLETIIVSGGKIGIQLEILVNDLQVVTNAEFSDITKD